MKKNLFYYLFAVLCTVTLVTSCSDDDGPSDGGTSALVGEIAGTYEGQLDVVMEGIPLATSNQYIFISKDQESKVKLELRDFSIPLAPGEDPVSIGTITVPGIELEGDNSNVVLKSTDAVINHPDLGHLDVTVSGKVVDKKADFLISVVYAEVVNIKVTFEGQQVSSDIDNTDYATSIAAWYKRTDLTATGMEEVKYPNTGIELTRIGLNEISINKFTLSCINPSNSKVVTRSITVESAKVVKKTDGLYINQIKQTLTSSLYGDAEFELSGKVVDQTLTLNMKMTQGDLVTDYVYTGVVKKNGTKIESMTVEGNVVLVQPEFNGTTIVFYVKPGTTSEEKKLVPTFTCSDGAIITIADEEYVPGTVIDFSSAVKVKVIAESGSTSTYTIKAEELDIVNAATNLDEWVIQNASGDEWQQFEEPVNGWATSNAGVMYIKLFYPGQYATDKPYVVTSTSDAKSGKAARLETVNTNPEFAVSLAPVVTSGTVFTGTFKVNITNTLKSTQFGAPCLQEPKKFKGSYKYESGPIYYNCADPAKTYLVTVVKDKKDVPAMNAVLYEVDSYASDVLDGTNLLTSDKIVAVASVDGKEQASYVDFDVNFTYKPGKSYNSSKKYKLAIVCSSSKDGDHFSGAPGSVLYLDNLEVTF
ncbi:MULTISPECIES: PCMD domain-containing protein [Bacteroides]|uniref:PCMD domain-containing protein n=1 Tax=Bacteroides TaxID=816 RepID=UPI00189DCD5F|nr:MULTISPECIES: PCMD domain-containing protein [Bacteroides]MDC2615784.1 PCMD domain-containing protein [Bacteroides ovatus]MDC2635001.1 PCMD domain-containing protein [Bacteroides ovatus]